MNDAIKPDVSAPGFYVYSANSKENPTANHCSVVGMAGTSMATPITAGNADALSWLDAGRLRVGACADLLIIRPSIDWQSANSDPLSKLMFGWDDRWIQHVFLRGKLARSYN